MTAWPSVPTKYLSVRNGKQGAAHSAGRVIRVDVWGAEDEISLLLKRELAGMPLPAFTPEQAAERRTLGLRGRLSVGSDACTLQRGGRDHLLPTV